VVNYLSRYVNEPNVACWKAAKHVLRYLKRTKNYGLHYRKDVSSDVLLGYADADFGSDVKDRKSFSGNLFEVFGNLVEWSVRKQNSVALSTAEAEYISLSIASCEGLWLRSLLTEMGLQCDKFTILEDNQSTIYLTRGIMNNRRSRHIDIRYHHVKDLIEKNVVDVDFIESRRQKSDILTKCLNGQRLSELCKSLNLF